MVAKVHISWLVGFGSDRIGQSGLGKATFINSLFDSIVIPPREEESIDLDLNKIEPVRFVPYSFGIQHVEFDSNSRRINFTIIDTPGFGESLSNAQGCATILEYLEEQYDRFLAEESRINRIKKIDDTRVHLLLYFITPSGHGLKDLDILLMKSVGKRVNVIPIIAKSDALTKSELSSFKAQIMNEIKEYNIPIYEFESCDADDSDVIQFKREAKKYLPFAIIGSEPEFIGHPKASGVRRGRQLPWGFIDIDNPEHSDFFKLKSILLGQFMDELKENISDNLYEEYRTEKLSRQSEVNKISSEEVDTDQGDNKILIAKALAKAQMETLGVTAIQE